MTRNAHPTGEYLDKPDPVARLSEAVPGLSAMDYRTVLRIASSFEDAVELAAAKRRTVI